MTWLPWVAAAVGAIVALNMCSQKSSQEIAADQAATEMISAQVDAEHAVRALLRDPDSAKFSDELVPSMKGPVVCGYVNAKNGFGGFTGRLPFVVIGRSVTVSEDSPSAAFRRLWDQACTHLASAPSATR